MKMTSKEKYCMAAALTICLLFLILMVKVTEAQRDSDSKSEGKIGMKRLLAILILVCAPLAARAQQAVFVPVCSGNATADTAALTALKTIIGATNLATIQPPAKLDPTKLCKFNAITLTPNLTIDFTNGGIQGVTGQTVTIQGPIVAPTKKVFYNFLSGQATLSFAGNRSLKEVLPEWWGAAGDKVTDDSAAIQAALTAAGTLTTP